MDQTGLAFCHLPFFRDIFERDNFEMVIFSERQNRIRDWNGIEINWNCCGRDIFGRFVLIEDIVRRDILETDI